MDRRNFIESCSASAVCLSASAAIPAFAMDAKPKAYARVLLTDDHGDPIKASRLAAQTNYVFHYPFEATPVFLLNLGKPITANTLTTKTQDSYAWPGGVGSGKSVVAFSAICAHQLVYPQRRRAQRQNTQCRQRPDPLLRRPQPVRPRARRQSTQRPRQPAFVRGAAGAQCQR
jgi:arsenite oxidase small subunit